MFGNKKINLKKLLENQENFEIKKEDTVDGFFRILKKIHHDEGSRTQ